MLPQEFISALDEKRLTDAIARAESATTGQLRIFVSSHKTPDPLATAQRHFRQLRMHHTSHRNAILLFLAPRSCTFAIVGDTGIHHKVPPDFWQSVKTEMTPLLKSAHYTEALLLALDKCAQQLTTHFPSTGHHKNELPDSIARD